jgi:hypothetical protein
MAAKMRQIMGDIGFMNKNDEEEDEEEEEDDNDNEGEDEDDYAGQNNEDEGDSEEESEEVVKPKIKKLNKGVEKVSKKVVEEDSYDEEDD